MFEFKKVLIRAPVQRLVADKTAQTIYQLKHGLLSDYLKQQLRNPAIAFS